MKRLITCVALLCAAGVGAQSIQEWKTRTGTLYFGDHPPEGSVPLKKVDKPIGRIAVPNRPAVHLRQQYAWRDGVGCQELTFSEVKEEPFDGIPRRIVRGRLIHNGNHLVKNAKVCAGAVCDELRGGDRIRNGESEAFYLDVPSAAPISLYIECSVREPVGPG